MSWPVTGAARDRFVLERRPERPAIDPWQPQGLVIEDERGPDGVVRRGVTVFLTGRECPWRCVMCDLWTHTTTTDTPIGAIPAQLAAARAAFGDAWPSIRQVKLYNAGSFFDPRAVPEQDYDAVATLLHGFERVIVESHPALVGARVDRLIEALARHRAEGEPPVVFEVAMGLETAHPEALERLHKRMTVKEFTAASRTLAAFGVALRVFLLIAPPFIAADEQDEWLMRSIDVALACGASVISLIPTRTGNGALDELAGLGLFRAPRLEEIERSIELAVRHADGRGRVFVDLWDLERFASCRFCLDDRRARLHAMNLEQRPRPRVMCARCDGETL